MLGLFFCIIYLVLLSFVSGVFIWSFLVCSLIVLCVLFLFIVPIEVGVIGECGLYLDLLRGVLVCLRLWIRGLILLASQKVYIEKENIVGFILLIVILCFILVLAFLVGNIVSFYVFFEASLLPTFLLVLGWGYQPERLQAGIYLILYTITASLPLLFSLILVRKICFHLSFIIPFWRFLVFGGQVRVWWVITVGAFLVKTPMFLVHL